MNRIRQLRLEIIKKRKTIDELTETVDELNRECEELSIRVSETREAIDDCRAIFSRHAVRVSVGEFLTSLHPERLNIRSFHPYHVLQASIFTLVSIRRRLCQELLFCFPFKRISFGDINRLTIRQVESFDDSGVPREDMEPAISHLVQIIIGMGSYLDTPLAMPLLFGRQNLEIRGVDRAYSPLQMPYPREDTRLPPLDRGASRRNSNHPPPIGFVKTCRRDTGEVFEYYGHPSSSFLSGLNCNLRELCESQGASNEGGESLLELLDCLINSDFLGYVSPPSKEQLEDDGWTMVEPMDY